MHDTRTIGVRSSCLQQLRPCRSCATHGTFNVRYGWNAFLQNIQGRKQPCLRIRRAFVTKAVAAADPTRDEERYSDGLNGFIPSWARGAVDVKPVPEAAAYQQTVTRSCFLGGIGLHSGEYSFVRIRPAFAGEGRYFVRVPVGTNSTRYDSVAPDEEEEEEEEEEEDDEDDDEEEGEDEAEEGGSKRARRARDPDKWSPVQTQRFLLYLNAQDNGYEGSYYDWSMEVFGEEGHVHVDQLDDYFRRAAGSMEQDDEPDEDLSCTDDSQDDGEIGEAGDGEDDEDGTGVADDGQEGEGGVDAAGREMEEERVPQETPLGNKRHVIDLKDLEEIKERGVAEKNVILCTIEHMDPGEGGLSMDLVQGENRVRGVELLLAALEACGVDNARIEIEGGEELPIDDGSALAWTMQIQAVGLRPAPSPQEGVPIPRIITAPKHTISVARGDSFITFYPAAETKISYGVDFEQEAPVIGRQWYSWVPGSDANDSFRRQIAPARTFLPSLKTLYERRSFGFYKGGTVGSAIIGYGDRWYENALVRYHDSEPARHKILGLVGDLSLLSVEGNAGVLQGHIVAYNADHRLHAVFLTELRDACYDAEMVSPPLPGDGEDSDDDDDDEGLEGVGEGPELVVGLGEPIEAPGDDEEQDEEGEGEEANEQVQVAEEFKADEAQGETPTKQKGDVAEEGQ